MSFQNVLDMPIRTFWSFVKNSIRLEAEEDLRSLSIAQAAQDPEGGKRVRDDLMRRAGYDQSSEASMKARFEEGDHEAGLAQLAALQQ